MRSSLLYLLLLVCSCQAEADKETSGQESTFELCVDEEEEKLPWANEPCKVDKDCYNYLYNSTSCKNGKCTCQEDFLAAENTMMLGNVRLVCLPVPSLNMSCNTTCERPLQCVNASSDNEEFGFDDLEPQKICRCLPPHVEVDGMCVLDCKDDIYFEGQCRKRCAANEIFAEDGTCKKMGNLGDKCTDKCQCSTPFSECKNGTCGCVTGFDTKNGACETTAYSCPIGDPVKAANNSVGSCEIIFGSKTLPPSVTTSYLSLGRSDTCDADHYCQITNGYSSDRGSTGFCCPIPKLACPIGNPHPTATCNSSVSMSADNYCPTETHSCRQITFAETGVASLCCPDHCHRMSIRINNRCYPRRGHGDQCDYDQQCSDIEGICENGKCTCPKNMTTVPAGPYKYCTIICKEGEDRIGPGGQCAPLPKLDDKCDPAMSEPCPLNAHCSPISSTCKCDCGQVRLDSRTCRSPPKCPAPSNDPFDREITVDPSKAKFCIPDGIDKPLLKTAVKECPSGQYCRDYQEDLGICCQKPAKLICPNGETATKPCDRRKLDECGNEDCINILGSIGVSDISQGMCCEDTPVVPSCIVGPSLSSNETDTDQSADEAKEAKETSG